MKIIKIENNKDSNIKNLFIFRVLVCGGNTPIGCILIQLVKIWGGHVVTTCRSNGVSLMQALGADHVITMGESSIQKELELLDR